MDVLRSTRAGNYDFSSCTQFLEAVVTIPIDFMEEYREVNIWQLRFHFNDAIFRFSFLHVSTYALRQNIISHVLTLLHHINDNIRPSGYQYYQLYRNI